MKLDDEYIRDLIKYKDITITNIEINSFRPGSYFLNLEAKTKSNKAFGLEYRRDRKSGMFSKTNIDMYSEHDGDIFMYKSYTGQVGQFRDCWFFRHNYNGRVVHPDEILDLEALRTHLKTKVGPEGYKHFMELIDFLDIASFDFARANNETT